MLKSIATAILLAGIGLASQPALAEVPFSAAVRVGNLDFVVGSQSSYYYNPYDYYGYRSYGYSYRSYGYPTTIYSQPLIVVPRYSYPIYSPRVYVRPNNYYYRPYWRHNYFRSYGRY